MSLDEPPCVARGAAIILARHYALHGDITPLTAERDENFRVRSPQGEFVLKVFASGTPADEADMLCAVLRHLEANAEDLPVPRLTPAPHGEPYVRLSGEGESERLAVLYSFLPGTPLMDVDRSVGQARACGMLGARLAMALHDFVHPAMHRRLIWDLRHLPDLAAIAASLREVPFADFVLPFIDRFSTDIAPALDALPRQCVHNDLNARNVIVAISDPEKIAGIIDFGDSVHTARVCDIAVGVIGQLAHASTAEGMMRAFLEGYESAAAMTRDEREIVPSLVAARIVQNVVMTSYYREKASGSGHFSGFGKDYFGWRVAFAQSLVERRG